MNHRISIPGPRPKQRRMYIVVCRNVRNDPEHLARYVLATRRVFASYHEANEYAVELSKLYGSSHIIEGEFHELRIDPDLDEAQVKKEREQLQMAKTTTNRPPPPGTGTRATGK